MTRVRHEDVSGRTLVKLVVAGGALIAATAVLDALASLVSQLVVASFIAVALDTVVRWLEGRGIGRGRAVLGVLLSVTALTLLAVIVVVGPLVRGGRELVDAAPAVVRDLESSAGWDALEDALHLDGAALDGLRERFVELPAALADAVMAMVGGIFGLVNFALMIIFLLVGGEAAVGYIVRLWPRLGTGAPWVVITGAYRSIGRYLLGATAQATLAAVALALVLWLLGTPYVLPLALLMFLLDYVPLVGATLASIPAVAVTLFDEGTGPAIVMVLFLIVYQQVENAIIQPQIQGEVVHLPVIAIFLSVMAGAELFGIAGALLAVPTAAIVAIAIDQWLQLRPSPAAAVTVEARAP